MGFRDIVEAVDPIIVGELIERPPRFYWFNGNKQARTRGEFYIKEVEVTSDPPGEPWQESARFDNEIGYAAPKLRIAIIGVRRQAFVSIRDGAKEVGRQWLPHWKPGIGATFYSEYLCFAEAFGETPMTLCAKGLTGKALDGILKAYQAKLLRLGEKEAGRRLPMWSFWLPMATALDEKGRTIYADTGHGAFITPPALFLPDLPDEQLVEALFVGPDLLDLGGTIRLEYDDWLKEVRTNDELEAKSETDGNDKAAAAAAFADVAGRGHAVVDAASANEIGYNEVEVPFTDSNAA